MARVLGFYLACSVTPGPNIKPHRMVREKSAFSVPWITQAVFRAPSPL